MKLRTKVKRLKAENARLKQQIFEPRRLVKQDRNVICLRADARIDNYEMNRINDFDYHEKVLVRRLKYNIQDEVAKYIHIEKQENIDRTRVEYMAELYVVQHEEV